MYYFLKNVKVKSQYQLCVSAVVLHSTIFGFHVFLLFPIILPFDKIYTNNSQQKLLTNRPATDTNMQIMQKAARLPFQMVGGGSR